MHRRFVVAASIVLLLALYALQGAYAKPIRAPGECEKNDECGLGVLCVNHTCVHCTSSSQCHQFVDHICVNDTHGHGYCKHKGILPVSWHDGVGYLLLSVSSAVAGASGMGGGPIFVPILILTFGFEAEYAIPLSKIMIFGVAVSQFTINIRKKDPLHPERWLICYDVALLFVPMALFGTTVGVLLNLIFPSYVVVFSLFVVMMFSIAKTIINFVQIRRKAINARAAGVHEPDETLPVAPGSYTERSSLIDAAKINSEPRTLYAKSITVWCILFLLLVWVFIVGISVIKGGQSSTIHGVALCSWGYWVLFVAVGPVMYLFTVAVGVWFRTRAESNEKLGIINTDEMEWNKRNTILYPWLSFAAGVAAGMMGVGAGVVLGPLLLELGMRPETGAATTAFMILFTSSSVTVQFLVLGRLPEAYAIPLCICGFLTCYVGKIGINRVVDKYGKPYFLVFTLIVFLTISMVALGGLGIWQIVDGQTQMGFSTQAVCGKG